MKIFKYSFNEDKPTNIISMPIGAKVLSAKIVYNQAQLWALVNPANRLVDRTILSWTTGTSTPAAIQNASFIDTLVFNRGGYICHIFAVPEN